MTAVSSAGIRRGQLLLERSRPDLAEPELRGALAADPDDWLGHALLAICLRDMERLPEATSEAESAIRLAPDLAFSHYAMATILHARERLDEAARAIDEALRLDPQDADYYARLAAIRLDQRRWQDALDAAERGLQTEPEHVGCNNLRAMALVQLGRRDEAGVTIAGALARDPANAVTHANQGWTLLHAGDYLGASNHFREALRLDPNSAWARDGIVEALKARNPIYAVLLRYSLWMSRLSGRAQWAVILVGFFGYRFLAGIERTTPSLSVVLLPLMIAYVIFALLTWIGDPVFTLLLRLDPFGRLAVTEEQRRTSTWVGAALLGGLLSLVLVFTLSGLSSGLLAGLSVAALSVPLSAIPRIPSGWPRRTMIGLTGLVTALALLGVATMLLNPAAGTSGLLGLALAGTYLTTWAANFLAMARPKR